MAQAIIRKALNEGTENSSEKNANKAQQRTHIHTYDKLNQLVYRRDSQNHAYNILLWPSREPHCGG